MNAAASYGGPEGSGCVAGRACRGFRFALPENWGRNSLVGGGGLHQRSWQREGRLLSDA